MKSIFYEIGMYLRFGISAASNCFPHSSTGTSIYISTNSLVTSTADFALEKKNHQKKKYLRYIQGCKPVMEGHHPER